jgi:hypothetical protein
MPCFAIKTRPAFPEALNNLAWMLATQPALSSATGSKRWSWPNGLAD